MNTSTKIALGVGTVAVLGVGAALLLSDKGGGAAGSAAPPPAVANGDQALIVGDSIGVGLGVPLGKLLVAQGISPLVAAKTGLTAKGLLASLKAHPDTLQAASKVSILSLGSNDAAMLDPLAERADIVELANLLRSKGGRIVWVSPPNFSIASDQIPKPATDAKQAAFATMMHDDAGITELIVPTPEVLNELGPDRIHLTPKGYALYAALVADYVTGKPSV